MADKKRLIDANRVVDAIILQFPQINIPFVQMALENIPTVDAVEVVHGRWRWCGQDKFNDAYECSECGKIAMDDSNYCPNCGAKMDGERRPNVN